MKERLNRLWLNNRGLLLFIALMLVFRSTFADWNDVPSGSMRPTIIEGDRIFVNKMAYDLRVPFTLISLWKIADPQRGDVAVFDSAFADKRLIKRVVGLPGDVVEMVDSRLVVNGEAVTYSTWTGNNTSNVLLERLGSGEHLIVARDDATRGFNSFSAVTVPPDHYLVLGDNRDNSADSRVIGFVPRHEFVGRSGRVVVSLDYDNYLKPRSDRFFRSFSELPQT